MRVTIPCRVSEGMFANEYAAVITLVDGQMISLFVDRALVQVEKNSDRGRMTVALAHETVHEKTVLLPSEAFESGSRWARLPANQVLAA